MGKFKPFLLGSLLGAGIAICALQFHVVQSQDGFRVIPRTPQPSLGLVYADVRNWDAETWADRPELVRALVAHGATDLVASSVVDAAGDALTPEHSTLDELRNILNESKPYPGSDAPLSTPGPLQSPENASGEPAMDDLFTLPFPQDARTKSSASMAAAGDAFPTRSIARREQPAIDDVLNAGEHGLNRISNAADERHRNPAAAAAPAAAIGASAAAESELVDGMLFGEDDDSASVDESMEYGVFKDVTSTLENRAEEALQRARVSIQQQSDQVAAESAESVNRYVRDKTRQTLPAPVADFFTEDLNPPASSGGTAASGELPSALRAIRDGFDPFVE